VATAGDRAVCLDLDGVVWRGSQPVPGSADAVAQLRADGLRVGFVTNNSGTPLADVVAKLEKMGVPADPKDVITSAVVAAHLLARELAPGAKVLPCAGAGVVAALTERGFALVDRGPADAVVVGIHTNFDYDELDRTSAALRDGAKFIATNADPTYPARDRVVPGNGALVAAVATASGVAPVVVGKPEQPMADVVREQFGTGGVMIGDRPSTDGAFATVLGWPFGLVLSGVAQRSPGPADEPVPDPPPPFLGDDLAAIAPAVAAALTDQSGS
jgi:HAD superfamily hydrolase (TIGR01450 family)